MGSSFLSKNVLFLHEVQIGEKELVLVTAILLLHEKEDDRAANPYFHTMLGRVWSSESTSNCINNFYSVSKYVFQIKRKLL